MNDDKVARDTQLVQLDRRGLGASIEANSDAVLLMLSGEPIDEPVVGYGPFVMNSESEIRQAIADLYSRRFGQSLETACKDDPFSVLTFSERIRTMGLE